MQMLTWLRNLFTKKESKPQGCCGGHCCAHENQEQESRSKNQEASAEDLNLGISQSDKEKLKTLDSLVVVGKVLEVKAHSNPEMTKVRVSQCDLGNGEVVQILCGGTNLEEGQVVAVAKVGCVLPGDFEIGVRDIRGELSSGMICASKELGLERPEEEQFIWPLPGGFERFLGQSINQLV